jgi:hypothetical protein
VPPVQFVIVTSKEIALPARMNANVDGTRSMLVSAAKKATKRGSSSTESAHSRSWRR